MTDSQKSTATQKYRVELQGLKGMSYHTIRVTIVNPEGWQKTFIFNEATFPWLKAEFPMDVIETLIRQTQAAFDQANQSSTPGYEEAPILPGSAETVVELENVTSLVACGNAHARSGNTRAYTPSSSSF